jgi:hypothetical protein
VHTAPGAPYNRAWAFNVGVALARAPIVVLHDNDMLVPRDYAACALRRMAEGHDVANLKRFVFYFDPERSAQVIAARAVAPCVPESTVQNLEAGGSVAIRKSAYDAIGGMDEGFVGWGGEDNEFWERCGLLPRWEYGELSLVHLWHESQPQKGAAENTTLARYRRLEAIAPAERARRLREAARGSEAPRDVDPFAREMAEG